MLNAFILNNYEKTILIISLFFALNFFTPSAEAQSSKPLAGFVIAVTAENAGKGWIYISQRQNGVMSDIDSSHTTIFPILLLGKQDVLEMLD